MKWTSFQILKTFISSHIILWNYTLSSMNVKPGDYVKQNQLIGKSGSTGLATGPHLHWEMRLNAGAVRPEFFMEDFTFSEDN